MADIGILGIVAVLQTISVDELDMFHGIRMTAGRGIMTFETGGQKRKESASNLV